MEMVKKMKMKKVVRKIPKAKGQEARVADTAAEVPDASAREEEEKGEVE